MYHHCDTPKTRADKAYAKGRDQVSRLLIFALFGAFLVAAPAGAEPLAVKLDVEAARAVLAAVRNPALTPDQARAIASLPGNQGLIRKIKSYGRQADEPLFVEALLAAAQHRQNDADKNFRFAAVRDSADKIAAVLAELTDPARHTLDDVQRRIALFAPPGLSGRVTGYMIVGGTSGGFAFGEPEFFLDLAHFPQAALATTITEHELYHAVQALAAAAYKPALADKQCRTAVPGASRLDFLFQSLMEEGTASYVGDVLALPDNGDPAIKTARDRLTHGLGLLHRNATLLELSVHAMTTSSSLSDDDIYAIGFYDDEILYPLGYAMARAISDELGPGAVADLIGKPGALFVVRYASLKSYGKDSKVPKLDDETVRYAQALAACG